MISLQLMPNVPFWQNHGKKKKEEKPKELAGQMRLCEA